MNAFRMKSNEMLRAEYRDARNCLYSASKRRDAKQTGVFMRIVEIIEREADGRGIPLTIAS